MHIILSRKWDILNLYNLRTFATKGLNLNSIYFKIYMNQNNLRMIKYKKKVLYKKT